MKKFPPTLVLMFAALLDGAMPAAAQDPPQPPTTGHPYESLAPRLETRLRFVTDFAFPGGPSFQVKVYDWVIGPRQQFLSFPLEGFATIELVAGGVETVINGGSVQRHQGETWVVAEGARLDIKVATDTGRGDNVVSLHGVVVIRK